MNKRSVEQWKKTIRRMERRPGERFEEVVAQCMLDDLSGYNHRSRHRAQDVVELANLLEGLKRAVTDVSTSVPSVYRDGGSKLPSG
jgi:hypothetical protein